MNVSCLEMWRESTPQPGFCHHHHNTLDGRREKDEACHRRLKFPSILMRKGILRDKRGAVAVVFWNLPLCKSSSLLHIRVSRLSFGMTRVIDMILLLQKKFFCFNLKGADKSPKFTKFSFCDILI